MKMLSDYPVYATIATADLARARAFYEETLGFSIVTEDQVGGIYYRSGTTRFYLYASQFAGHAQHTLASWEVDDIASAVDELAARGVVFEKYDLPGLKTDERGIADLGDTKAAWFKDPDGNILNVGQTPTG
jgi:catechol 2,3-dioxygenase-like lactoylglutathione lyase family enzyme